MPSGAWSRPPFPAARDGGRSAPQHCPDARGDPRAAGRRLHTGLSRSSPSRPPTSDCVGPSPVPAGLVTPATAHLVSLPGRRKPASHGGPLGPVICLGGEGGLDPWHRDPGLVLSPLEALKGRGHVTTFRGASPAAPCLESYASSGLEPSIQRRPGTTLLAPGLKHQGRAGSEASERRQARLRPQQSRGAEPLGQTPGSQEGARPLGRAGKREAVGPGHSLLPARLTTTPAAAGTAPPHFPPPRPGAAAQRGPYCAQSSPTRPRARPVPARHSGLRGASFSPPSSPGPGLRRPHATAHARACATGCVPRNRDGEALVPSAPVFRGKAFGRHSGHLGRGGLRTGLGFL